MPRTAAGFVQPDASAGLVALDAIGLGPDGVTHSDATSLAGLAPHGDRCGTVETLPFHGFIPPVAAPPTLNVVQAGSTVPVRFTIPGSGATLANVLSAGYPQSAPVSCTAPDLTLTSGTPTTETTTVTPPPGDPVFSRLPPAAERRDLRLVPAAYQKPGFGSGGWSGPGVTLVFDSAEDPRAVYRFVGREAQASGWTSAGMGSIGLPDTWRKRYANGALGTLTIFDHESQTASASSTDAASA